MNAITGILSRELLNNDSITNILWTPSDSMVFEQSFKKLKCNLLGFDNLYFGKDSPHMIVCNNKVLYYEKCKNLSIQFHIPVLMIDHNTKPKELNNDEVSTHNYVFPCAYTIAIGQKVAESWGASYNKILTPKDMSNADLWQEIVNKTRKKMFQYYV